ncbi:hypothetical protein ATANTOWER_005978 [Ataeniobius toweri]|uniref:Uncharacterized protein n=1 Tax=Ataeniobius toweri TaxID=208326 RepID=A0ABU7BH90_9TELE|nr:hypothetical protein [Ataeniobius toweri]
MIEYCLCMCQSQSLCALTGHFIRYALLVPVWTHSCLQNCLNSWTEWVLVFGYLTYVLGNESSLTRMWFCFGFNIQLCSFLL